MAIGSAAELDTLVELARRLEYVTAERTRDLDAQLDRVQQMLYGMRREHAQRLGAAGAALLTVFGLLRARGFFP